MAAKMETANRNKAIVHALCKRLSLDPQNFPSEINGTNDIMSLVSNILQLSGPLTNQNVVMEWMVFANNFPCKLDASGHGKLKDLNEGLAQKAVLLGYGLQPSEADIVVFASLHSFVNHLSDTDMPNYPNLLRWMDYIQNKEDFGGALATVVVNKPQFEHFCSEIVDKTGPDRTSKKTAQASKDEEKVERYTNSVKGDPEKQASADDKPSVESKKNIKSTDEKKKPLEKESSEKDTDSSVTILNIQVGLIRKAWKHPSADSLLVEEIDLGDGNVRQVVSGLAEYYSPDDLTNRRVVLITNVKPGKLRDVMSAGLVLCASNQDHTVVEPLVPPEGASIGERVSFSGYEGKPEDVLNPKKKQLEKITPHLHTDDKGIATYKGLPFMTSAGPCTSSIPNASIK